MDPNPRPTDDSDSKVLYFAIGCAVFLVVGLCAASGLGVWYLTQRKEEVVTAPVPFEEPKPPPTQPGRPIVPAHPLAPAVGSQAQRVRSRRRRCRALRSRQRGRARASWLPVARVAPRSGGTMARESVARDPCPCLLAFFTTLPSVVHGNCDSEAMRDYRRSLVRATCPSRRRVRGAPRWSVASCGRSPTRTALRCSRPSPSRGGCSGCVRSAS